MKKLIIVLAVSMFASNGFTQTNKKVTNPITPELKKLPLPPIPPIPPLPPLPPIPPIPSESSNQVIDFTLPEIEKDIPAPPNPPIKPIKFKPPVIVNENGYAIIVKNTTDGAIILLRKKGITQKINLAVWNAKPGYFENKYGKLPLPLPPVPPIPSVKE